VEGKAAGGKVGSDTTASEAGALRIVRAIRAILAIRAMPEHEFRHRIREHLARIDERLERIEERLGRLER
jgi:hypothetical protein